MLTLATALRDLLVPLLTVGLAMLLGLLSVLVLQRLLRSIYTQWRNSVLKHYGPLVDAVLGEVPDDDALMALARAPRRHLAVIAERLLTPLRIVKGQFTERALQVADRLGLRRRWRDDLTVRRWSRRAEAATALGLTRDGGAVPLLLQAMNDAHQQVRAAAIDALGRIGDPAAIPALLAHLVDRSRHDRARVVEALRAFGSDASAALLQHAAAYPADRRLVAEILSYVGASSARLPLLEWTSSDDAATRAAAWRAMSAIGLDDRAFYYALKALDDSDPITRAAAARAIGRSGRAEASPHLARRLDDEWTVAAETARALARLGRAGLRLLEERASGADGVGRDLARQLVWEMRR